MRLLRKIKRTLSHLFLENRDEKARRLRLIRRNEGELKKRRVTLKALERVVENIHTEPAEDPKIQKSLVVFFSTKKENKDLEIYSLLEANEGLKNKCRFRHGIIKGISSSC